MIIRLRSFCYLLVIIITVGSPIVMITDAYAQRPEESLNWSIETSKGTFYPGEPVLLTLNIRNTGQMKEKVNFGTDGIEAFSIEIHNSSNKIVAKGGKIQRFGLARLGSLAVAPGQVAEKAIVLNQWCSTLLMPGRYHIICNVEYRLRSESRWDPARQVFKAGPFHTIELDLDIQILEMDTSKFKKILEDMARREVKTDTQSQAEWLRKWQIAREMLAFTESPLAVPYQLHILKVGAGTWLKRDVINSLARSGTLEAANGFMQIIEGCPQCGVEDVKQAIIDAVYRLRETGKSDIINATDEFVVKYKRPVLAKPRD